MGRGCCGWCARWRNGPTDGLPTSTHGDCKCAAASVHRGREVPHPIRCLEVQMKKLLVLAAATLLAVAPAAAQQSPSGDQAVVEQVASVQQEAQEAAAPSIFVSRQEIQQRVAAL